MIEFDLKKALNGEPVVLRNGLKAYIFKNIQDIEDIFDGKTDYPLVGMVQGTLLIFRWSISGKCVAHNYSKYSIAGMWKDPINPEDLPKPFIPREDEPYYYIYGGVVNYESEYWESNDFDRCSAKHGQCFRTEEDAQVWLDFMKSKLE
jgi:hypothetical protein|nr:MAG TPA: hypothetical protein [Caudoviricetes sp.]